MAPANTNEGVAFSGRDAKMASLALKLLPPDAKAKINFQVFVDEFGQKDIKSAKECFRQICKKHGWFEGMEGAGAPSTPPSMKKTPVKRSATKKAKSPADDSESGIEESPTKKRRVNPKRTAHVKEEEIEAASEAGRDLDDLLDGMA